MIFTRNTLLTRLGIDTTSYESRLYRDAKSTSKTWEIGQTMGTRPTSPTQNGNRKPARSQVGVHKISLATANASSNASTSITTDKLLFYLLCLLMYNKWMNKWKRLKVTFRTTYFPPEKNYLRNRKVPENSGNDSRYNRCNLYHNTVLTKALSTWRWDN